jgi:hypothetical protein
VCTCVLCTNFRYIVNKFAGNKQLFTEDSILPEDFTPHGLARAFVCSPINGQAFSARECYNGSCSICGPIKLNLALKPECVSLAFRYRQYKRVRKPELDKTVYDVVEVSSDAPAALQELFSQLRVYVEHEFCIRWQRCMFKQSLEEMQPHELVSTADFAENITIEFDGEIQSMHWTKSQCSLFVEVLHYLQPSTSTLQPYILVTETHLVWSNDRKHDVAFAEMAHAKVHSNLCSRPELPKFKCWFRWTDNCSCQFKCADSFLCLSNSCSTFGIPVEHHFFERYHGKGLHDSEGGVAKAAVKKELLRATGDLPKDAAAIVAVCNEKITDPVRCNEGFQHRIHKRYCHELTTQELAIQRARQGRADTLPGTRGLRCVRAPGAPNALHTRTLSCTCKVCRRQLLPSMVGSLRRLSSGGAHVGNDVCPNVAYVGQWKHVEMEATDSATAAHQRQATHAARLVNLIRRGEVIAVNSASDEFVEYQYYLLKTTTSMHKVTTTNFQDGYGVRWSKGSKVIKGHYLSFQNADNPLSLRVDTDKVAAVHADSVIKRNVHVTLLDGGLVKISLAEHDSILACMAGFLEAHGSDTSSSDTE